MMHRILTLALLFFLNTAAVANPPATQQPMLLGGSVTTTLDPGTLTGGGSLSNGNMTYSSTGTASVVRSTSYSTGKFYLEFTLATGTTGSGFFGLGVVDSTQATVTPVSVATVTAKMWFDRNDALAVNNAASSAYGSTYGATYTISLAVDNTLGSGSGKVWAGQCSGGTITWPSSGDPAAGTNAMFSNLTGSIGLILNSLGAPAFSGTVNFGASAFNCTPPSGFGYLQ